MHMDVVMIGRKVWGDAEASRSGSLHVAQSLNHPFTMSTSKNTCTHCTDQQPPSAPSLNAQASGRGVLERDLRGGVHAEGQHLTKACKFNLNASQ